MKTRIIVLDTNVYGWYLSYIKGLRNSEAINSFHLLEKVIKQKNNLEIFTTQTIEREIKDAKDPNLSELFYSIIKGVIKNTKHVEQLSYHYLLQCKKSNLHFVTIDDCEILAATTKAGVKFFVTENRKTINNSKVIRTIESINLSKNLKTPKIINSKQALGEIGV